MLATMSETAALRLRQKVRRLTAVCLLLWLIASLMPIWAARTDLRMGAWPLDFWLAAQGCVLAYLMILVVYAWLVNRWERQAQALSFEIPPTQEG